MALFSRSTLPLTASSFCETPAAGLLNTLTDHGVPRLEPGTRLGAYEVTSFLAAGEMGEVYRARHTVLGREVAVKTLGARVSDEAALEFFLGLGPLPFWSTMRERRVAEPLLACTAVPAILTA